MERLRKIRNSVYFLDVLLALAVILAIIGLAVFARLHASKSPLVSAQTSKVGTIFNKATPLSPISDVPNDDKSNSGSSDVKGAKTNTPSSDNSLDDCYNSCGDTLPTLPISSVPVVTPACDEAKKAVLMRDYNAAVDKENQRYNQEIRTRQRLLGSAYMSLDEIIAALFPEHQRILNDLLNSLHANLSAIGC